MGYSKHKQQAKDLNKAELTIFYQPQPTHIIRMGYLVKNGKRLMKMPTHRFERGANEIRTTNTSLQTSRKIRYAVNWLIEGACTKRIFVRDTKQNLFFKVGFCTLTFPAGDYFARLQEIQKSIPVSFKKDGLQYIRSFEERYQLAAKKLDSETKSCLENFLSRAREKWQMNLYVWKAETTKEGVMHFHISWDCFAHYDSIRKTWNKILHHHGFTRQFFEIHGNNNPPSTHIKAVNKVKNLASYICTYMSKKEEDRRIVSGRVWGCSEQLQYSRRLKLDCPSELSHNYDKSLFTMQFKHKVIETIATNLTPSVHIADLFLFDNSTLWQLPVGELKSDILQYIGKLRAKGQDLFYEVDSFKSEEAANKQFEKSFSPRPLPKLVQLDIISSN